MKDLIAIAVLGEKTREIGRNGKLLWNIPEDLRWVKEKTTGYPIIMGRKTYESIGRPLPHRTNIVLTKQTNLRLEGCAVVNDPAHAIRKAEDSPGGDEKIFIFGGEEVYDLYLEQCTKLLLTMVEDKKEGTSHFPEYKHLFFLKKKYDEKIFKNEKGSILSYRWTEWEKRG